MSRPAVTDIPHSELHSAAMVEHNLDISKLEGVSAGQYLEYHANRYVHTGSHCRELSNQMRSMFPDAERLGYAQVDWSCAPQNSHTDVFKYSVVQLE